LGRKFPDWGSKSNTFPGSFRNYQQEILKKAGETGLILVSLASNVVLISYRSYPGIDTSLISRPGDTKFSSQKCPILSNLAPVK